MKLKRKFVSIPEVAKDIVYHLRVYLEDEMGMTGKEIDKVISDYDLENKVCSNYEVYSHLNNEQLSDRVLRVY